MPLIHQGTTIEEIVERYPQLIRPLKEYGIACIRCGEPVWGTLEQITSEKKIPDIERIIGRLNDILSHPGGNEDFHP